MKKLAIFLVGIVLIVAVRLIPSESVLNMKGADNVTFVIDAALAIDENLDYIPSGNDAIINVSSENIKEKYEKYVPKSVIFEFDAQKKSYVKEFLLLGQMQTQNIDEMKIEYGYTSKFDKCEIIDGKKINVMIVEKDETLLVGFPIIMTGF